MQITRDRQRARADQQARVARQRGDGLRATAHRHHVGHCAADEDIVGGVGHTAGAPVGGHIPEAARCTDPFVAVVQHGERGRRGGAAQGVAGAVGDQRGVHVQTVGAGLRQWRIGELQLAALLAELDLRCRQRQAVGCDQAEVVGSDRGWIERFGVHQRDGAEAAALGGAVGQVAADQHRCHGVGHQGDGDGVRAPGVAAGVDGAHLQRHVGVTAVGRQCGQGGAQFEREAGVVAHHAAVQQQLDVAHLHVVGHHGLQREGAAFQHLDAGRAGVDVERGEVGLDGGGVAARVGAHVVDDLQSGRAGRDEGQAIADGDAAGSLGQDEAGGARGGVGAVACVDDVDRIQQAARAEDLPGCDEQAGSIGGQRAGGNRRVVRSADELQRAGVAHIDGGVALAAVVAHADVGDAATHEQRGWRACDAQAA